ncbi:NADP-specific glutamate dehydrogenase [Pelagicoccus sp. SDUM812002]|uniref:NADP-specific glutamate dehydrogenase n=1 Tax=Pelagicoccus sp. SDUM812002 TaxID=3041266 RepID=UPI00280F27B6|nr:NADP-specific glutamate dehydrogenase [Pelagicoccus sp. SDUM812002]MDQ8187823.1 NADP-specific glutamate dehydrogenase [Pelagicoccus sp. SDUM812002]
MSSYLHRSLETLTDRNPSQALFKQAVTEVFESLEPLLHEIPEIEANAILERISEPERQIMFRVTWVDDQGCIQVNRGYRVGFSSALGPYKGGMRFHPSVELDVIKFLAFEQIFKNSLTGLGIGGGKGGSDFDPKGKSDGEVMRFCQAFMSELYHFVGEDTDVPAGDIGVGAREIGYLAGQYKRLTKRFAHGVLTGKQVGLGGSLARKEATGYGAVYFAAEMLATRQDSLKGKHCVVSGSGNVAIYCARKIQELGGKVMAMSDSTGCVHDPAGIDLDIVTALKEVERARISEYSNRRHGSKFFEQQKVWNFPCEVAFPCATQNELALEDAKALLENGCQAVIEGANMPTTPEAIALLREKGTLFAPGKAANAGGVAVSALEMQQNAALQNWSFAQVDDRLKAIMANIHNDCVFYANKYRRTEDYVFGANVAGFLKVAEAVKSYGVF